MEAKNTAPNSHGRSSEIGGSAILVVLLCLIVVISAIFVVGAYYTYREHTYKVEATLKTIETRIAGSTTPEDTWKKNKYFLRYLGEIGKGATEAGNISFLFTIFSIALVSGGVYLLERSRQNIEDAKKMVMRLRNKARKAEESAERTQRKARTAADIFEKGETAGRVSSALYRAEHYSFRLRELKGGNEFDQLVVRGRDSVREAHEELEDVQLRGRTLDTIQAHHFRNTVDTIRANLESLPPSAQEKVEDIIERCRRIAELLRNLCPREQLRTRAMNQGEQFDD